MLGGMLTWAFLLFAAAAPQTPPALPMIAPVTPSAA